ncbi:MAG: MoaD/ThiS family protein [Gammaproteobacteria bacterium]|nr:MoaD/ThiS family protein [Gammaproteobacteria bacterium]
MHGGVRIVLPEALRELAGGAGMIELSGEEGAGGAPARGAAGSSESVGGGAGTGDRERGTADGALGTVGGVLGALRAFRPGLYDRLMTEQGALRPHVNIFVDGENIRFTGGLGTRVGEDSEIFVLPAISGG